MPSGTDLILEIQNAPSAVDYVRRKYLAALHKKRDERNIISYYSGYLTKKGYDTGIQDSDKDLLMSAVHQLDRERGLDLILHTEGGNIAATESIVDYLFKMFGCDIKVFVPQIAMSAGTLIACTANEIFMGQQSNLGPIDPHINGIAAKRVIEKYKNAKEDLAQNINVQYWQIELRKYPPTYLEICQDAVNWSETLAREWLKRNMFKEDSQADEKITGLLKSLTETEENFSHGRHIHVDKLKSLALNISCLEDDQDLQDLVLTLHHLYMYSFANTDAIKIIENHLSKATILHAEIGR